MGKHQPPTDTALTVAPSAIEATTGQEIHDLRRTRGLTLKELAALSGLSVGHLSDIERGRASPSVKALREIAAAMGVTIGWFMHNAETADPAERPFIVRSNTRRKLTFRSGISDELLSPGLNGALEAILSRFPPGSSGGDEPYSHRGEETGLVISGRLTLWIGEAEFTLDAGDSFGFPSSTPHRYSNPGPDEAVVVWVITPPSY
jgi:transcriptional regulator with XRE-family HTH domain